MPDLLDFEEPIGILLKEIEALSMLAVSDDRDREIDRLEKRIDGIRGELYKNADAVAARAGGPPPGPADDARLC